jgi:lactobin A/cerein 7B family class IIb bacteriocin
METKNYQVVELNNEELNSVEGGILQCVLAGIAITGAIYAAGHAFGEAYYYYTHSK